MIRKENRFSQEKEEFMKTKRTGRAAAEGGQEDLQEVTSSLSKDTFEFKMKKKIGSKY